MLLPGLLVGAGRLADERAFCPGLALRAPPSHESVRFVSANMVRRTGRSWCQVRASSGVDTDEVPAGSTATEGEEASAARTPEASAAASEVDNYTVSTSRRYPVPVLGAFAIADAELNIAMPPPSRRPSSRWDPRTQQDRLRKRGRQTENPGFKPVAGLGAILGFLAAGPAGAIAGAAASFVTSKKDSLAGDTVRTVCVT